jgi:DNA-binding transcriptional ArsR family regulator
MAEIDVTAMQSQAHLAAALLKSLANEHRLLILCLLSEGELSVSQINERVSLTQSALSQHLAVLRDQDMVTTRREAQTIYYSLQRGVAQQVINVLHDHYCCSPKV